MSNDNISEDTWWTIFGAGLAIIGCIFQAIGFIMQKIGHNKIEQYNNREVREHSRRVASREHTSYDADVDIVTDEDHATESLKGSPQPQPIASPLDPEISTPPIKYPDPLQLNSPSKSAKRRQSKDIPFMSKPKKRTYLQSRIWQLGFFLNGVVGSLLNIVALNYAPQSVVLPLSATTLVGNTILATRYLNEAMEIQDFVGVLLVILGSIGCIIVGPKEPHDSDADSETFTVAKLQHRWRDTPFLVFFCTLTVLIAIDYVALKVLDRINRRKKAELRHRDVLEFEGKEIGEHTIVYLPCFYLISYPLIAAFCASINFLILKSFIKIVVASMDSAKTAERNFTFYLTYVYILGILLINFLLEMHRQKGLRAFGAIYVIPIFQVLVITMGTTMGAIYFSEMRGMSSMGLGLFVLTVFVTCCGVVVLALSSKISKLLRDADCGRYIGTLNEVMSSDLNDPDLMSSECVDMKTMSMARTPSEAEESVKSSSRTSVREHSASEHSASEHSLQVSVLDVDVQI